jgi:predicted nucleotidyltransferase
MVPSRSIMRARCVDPTSQPAWNEPGVLGLTRSLQSVVKRIREMPDQIEVIEQVRAWALTREDLQALLLVGSHARGEARADSDVDLVFVTEDESRYLEDTSWVTQFGRVVSVQLEDHPPTTSVRAVYEDNVEVEFGIAPADWASPPFDPGTMKVARNGIRVLLDRKGDATELAAAAATA